jgi:broad specificity polyphosphatase/5'/3'-nucleotidase SurE
MPERVLLTNDDGYRAEGLLAEMLVALVMLYMTNKPGGCL